MREPWLANSINAFTSVLYKEAAISKELAERVKRVPGSHWKYPPYRGDSGDKAPVSSHYKGTNSGKITREGHPLSNDNRYLENYNPKRNVWEKSTKKRVGAFYHISPDKTVGGYVAHGPKVSPLERAAYSAGKIIGKLRR